MSAVDRQRGPILRYQPTETALRLARNLQVRP